MHGTADTGQPAAFSQAFIPPLCRTFSTDCLFLILTLSDDLSGFRTPEYMSPELLHNGQDGTDQAYDPRSTDVWAAGVMLVVALCGAFPFDHTQHQHRSMEEAELDLWYALCALPSLYFLCTAHTGNQSHSCKAWREACSV